MKSVPRSIAIWIIFSTALVAAGWILSLFHQLNAGGYLVLFGAVVPAALWHWRFEARTLFKNWSAKKFLSRLRRRFKRPLPRMFVLLALLGIGGGLLHAPNNYDALTYRVPRMLNWAAESQWHWIHTLNGRMNDRACGFEWLAMPFLIFTKTDRLIFLINSVSYLLLPGLIFGVFVRLGVRARVAWNWMWILPAGYNFLLQAGSASNDLFTVPYVLAAVDYALRARDARKPSHAWLSILAAGLMTGAKGTTLPLLLPWFVALAPSWRLMLKTPFRLAMVALISAVVSFLPTAFLNHKYCGDWSGTKLETVLPTPGISIVGNSLQLVAQNFFPPVFPIASWWNEHNLDLLPSIIRVPLQSSSWEKSLLSLTELPIEDSAPLGFGVSVLLVASLAGVLKKKYRNVRKPASESLKAVRSSGFNRFLLLLPWCSLLVYMAKVGLTASGRLITPFYILLFPLFLRPWQNRLVITQRWWRLLSLIVFWIAVFVIVVNPARPLWPAQTLLAKLNEWKPNIHLLQRAQTVYRIYAQRHEALAPIRNFLPPEAKRVGFLASADDPETSLWRPFGSRRIIHILPGDDIADLRRKGIEYIILAPQPSNWSRVSMDEWLRHYHAEPVADVTFAHRASQPPQQWLLVRLTRE